MNKTEQILMRAWNMHNGAVYNEEVLIAVGDFVALKLYDSMSFNINMTFSKPDSKYDYIKRMFSENEIYTCPVKLPTVKELKTRRKGMTRAKANRLWVDLSEPIPCMYNDDYSGTLRVNALWLEDFIWVLGDGVKGYWSGKIEVKRRSGDNWVNSLGALRLVSPVGEALIMPISYKVGDKDVQEEVC